MSAETILRNAATAEKRTRAIALALQQAAEKHPDNAILRVVAETTHIMLELAEKRAGLIDRKVVEARMEDFEGRTLELEEQLTGGLRSLDDALRSLDAITAAEAVAFAQHKLDAWETSEAEMRGLMTRAGQRDGA